jgi:hypothetical protein
MLALSKAFRFLLVASLVALLPISLDVTYAMYSKGYCNEQLSLQLGCYKHLVLLTEIYFHTDDRLVGMIIQLNLCQQMIAELLTPCPRRPTS